MKTTMMTVFVVALGLTSVQAATKNRTQGRLKRTKAASKRLLPKITASIVSSVNTNIDRLADPLQGDVKTQKIILKSKFKFRPARKVVLIDLPQIDAEYADSMEDKLRGLNATNTLLGLWFPEKGTVYTGALTAGYSDVISTNEEQEIEKNRYLTWGFDFGYSRDITKSFALNLGAGAKIQDYLEPSTENETVGDDNLRITGKIGTTYKFNLDTKFVTEASIERRLYKEKRALNTTGKQDALKPETTQTYKVSAGPELRIGNLSIKPTAGYTINKDEVHGGRSYQGTELKLTNKLSFDKTNITQKVSYKVRDYDSQQVDVDALIGNSPLLSLNIMNITHDFEIGSLLPADMKLLLGHQFQKNESNRDSDNVESQVFKIGLKMDI